MLSHNEAEKLVKGWIEAQEDMPERFRIKVYNHRNIPDARFCLAIYVEPRLGNDEFCFAKFNVYPDARLEVYRDRSLVVRGLLGRRGLSWRDALESVDRPAMVGRLKELLVSGSPSPFILGLEPAKDFKYELHVAFLIRVKDPEGKEGVIPVTVHVSKKEKTAYFSSHPHRDVCRVLSAIVRPEVDDLSLMQTLRSQIENRCNNKHLIYR